MSPSEALAAQTVIYLLVGLAIQSGLALIVALPYLWHKGEVPLRARLAAGLIPPLVLGLAPVVMLLGLAIIRGPNFIYPAYAFLTVGLITGLILPAATPSLRRRMIFGVPLLLALTWWSLLLVLAGGGMPMGLDAPLRFIGGLLSGAP